jgi:predicted small metal-binding protein
MGVGAFLPESFENGAAGGEMHRGGAFLPTGGDSAGVWGETHLLALAARQHGMVTTAQLSDAGIGRRSVARRVAKGWLVPRYRGVYQVGPVQAPRGPQMAAVLAAGPGSLLSHDSAAHLWGVRPEPDEVHVTTSHDRRPRPGLRTHRTTRTDSLNAAVLDGLPLTGVHRTLQDLTRTLTAAGLDRAREQAVVRLHVETAHRGARSRGGPARRADHARAGRTCRMRVIECNECGDTVTAADDEELARHLAAHLKSEHGIEARDVSDLVHEQAYDAMDS